MFKNKKAAVVFRAAAFVVVLVGIINQLGIFHGNFNIHAFRYYTNISNLLALIMFGVLLVFARKGAAWISSFQMICAVDLLVTFCVFWALLAPDAPTEYLRHYDNLSVHLFAPLLCFADYLLFSEPNRLKHKDVYLTCVFPLIYCVGAIAAGFAGYSFGTRSVATSMLSSHMEFETIRAPYFFLDFDLIGMMVFAYIFAILLFIIALGYAFYFIDKKIRK